jgi:hypothetical protein
VISRSQPCAGFFLSRNPGYSGETDGKSDEIEGDCDLLIRLLNYGVAFLLRFYALARVIVIKGKDPLTL